MNANKKKTIRLIGSAVCKISSGQDESLLIMHTLAHANTEVIIQKEKGNNRKTERKGACAGKENG